MQEEENKYKVYMIINKVTGKYYIGKTFNTLQKRFKKHLSKYCGCKRLEDSIKHHGGHNFCIVQIGYPKTFEEMNEMEIYYIRVLKAQNTNIGYNIADGGGGINGVKMTDEHKKRQSINQTGSKKSNSASAYYGVSISKKRELIRWVARTVIHGKNKTIKYCMTEIEAAQAYNDFILQNSLPNPLNVINLEELQKIREIPKKICNVFWQKSRQCWISSFTENKKFHHVGSFASKEEAALGFNQYIIANNINKPLNPIDEKDVIKTRRIKHVFYDKRTNKYRSEFVHNKKRYYVGSSDNKEELALMYNDFIIERGFERQLNII